MPAPGWRDFRSSSHGSPRRSGHAPEPGADLVAPCRVVLRTAQAFRLVGRIGGGDRTVGPRQPALAGLVKRALRIGRNGQDAGCALNHNMARVGRSRPHQGDPTTPRLDLRAHPFGAATGLAKAAPRHHQPDPPGSYGRELFGPGAIAPIAFERVGFARRHRADQRVDLGFWQIGELFEQGGGHLFALLRFPRPDPVDLVDQPLPRIVDEKRFVVPGGRLVHHRLFPAHLGFGVEDRRGHADLFAFDRLAECWLFAEDRAEDKIADQRVEPLRRSTKLTVASWRSARKKVTSIRFSIVPFRNSEATRIPVDKERPIIVKAARKGWPVVLRAIITRGCDSRCRTDQAAGRKRRNRGGAGGCIATAGGRATMLRSAWRAPAMPAARLRALAMT